MASICTLRVSLSTFGLIALSAPSKRLAERVERQRDFLADVQLAEILLRQMEVDEHRIELLQRHDHRAGIEIRARIDRDDAGAAGERRAQLFLRDVDLLLLHRGLLGLEIGGGGVVVGLADRLHGQLLFRAAEGHLGQRGGGFELVQLGDVFAVAQLQQHLAFLDLVAGLHIDLGDEAGDIERKIGAACRAQ